MGFGEMGFGELGIGDLGFGDLGFGEMVGNRDLRPLSLCNLCFVYVL